MQLSENRLLNHFFSLEKEVNLHVSLLNSEIGGCQGKPAAIQKGHFSRLTLLNNDIMASIIMLEHNFVNFNAIII